MTWWLWILLGVALSLCEVILTPGVFVLLFFGLSSFVVAILVALGIGGSFWIQVAVLIILSTVLLLFFKNNFASLLKFKNSDMDLDSLPGNSCTALVEMLPNGHGKVELRGTQWNAINGGEEIISVNGRCRILRVERLTLIVKAE